MSEVSPTKPDANDYSRFNDIESTDSDDEKPETEVPTLSVSESIFKACGLKETGNAAFKANDLVLAKSAYLDALQLLNKHKDTKAPDITEEQQREISALLISLNGNLGMIYVKEEQWTFAVKYCNFVLAVDVLNVKALYRRGLAHGKLDNLDEAKNDLLKCLELDAGNAAARKELADVNKALKEHQKKDKALYSSLFSKGSMYEDREKERLQKEKREREAREKEQDDWSRSKLERREKGLPEQTFDEWKKERDDAAKAKKDEKDIGSSSSSSSAAASSSVPALKTPSDRPAKKAKSPTKKAASSSASADSDNEYDEEEAKIIAETKAKGYCYFRNEQSTEVKSLIGDITPKAISEASEGSTPVSTSGKGDPSSSSSSSSSSATITASSWNHAGTWEERDLSEAAKTRLKQLCLEARCESDPMDLSDPATLSQAVKTMTANLTEAHTGADAGQLSSITDAMSTLKASVVSATKVEGEAQMVMTRGKRRFMYDFNVSLDFEVEVDSTSWAGAAAGDAEASKKSNKKIKGTISICDMSPTIPHEPVVSFKKGLGSSALDTRVRAMASKLRDVVAEKLKAFEAEYTAM